MNYQTMKKAELVQILATQHGVDTPSDWKKPDIVDALNKLDKEKDQYKKQLGEFDDILGVEEIDEGVVQQELTPEEMEEMNIEIIPSMDSKGWTEYVLGQFEEDELISDAPTCDGCRRIVEKLIGPIIRCGVASNIGPSIDNHGTATVVFQVEVAVVNEHHPAHGISDTLFYEDIAEVNDDNTDEPYSRYKSATAATRAEGRIYRKLLRLTKLTTAEEVSMKAEEESTIDWVSDDLIDDSQISILNMMCQRTNVNLLSFINSGQDEYVDISQVPKKTVVRMIKELGKFQQGVKDVPETLRGYEENWRNNE